jgi:hypothetical protein
MYHRSTGEAGLGKQLLATARVLGSLLLGLAALLLHRAARAYTIRF